MYILAERNGEYHQCIQRRRKNDLGTK